MANAASEAFPAQTSLLLGLPAELRNHIYSYIACTDEPRLAINKVCQPDLTFGRTCRQIRKELLAVFSTFLREQAPELHVQVQDFDFTNLVRLTKAFRSQVVSTNAEEDEEEGKKPRQLNVELYLSKTAGNANLDSLRDWLQLCSSCEGLERIHRHYGPAVLDWSHYSVDSVSALEARLAEELNAQYKHNSDYVGVSRAVLLPGLEKTSRLMRETAEKERVVSREVTRLGAVLVRLLKRMRLMRKRRRQRFVGRRGDQEAAESVPLKGRRYAGLLGP